MNIKADSIVLTSNMRDEYYIPEWIAYHNIIGFDYIIIYDHCSIIPIKDTLSKYNFNNVYVLRDNEDSTLKTTMMNKILDILKNKKVRWSIHLDADEFLSLNGYYNNVKGLLNEYANADAIPITWIHFGTNYHSKTPSGLIIENFTKSTVKVDDHAIKTFINVNKAVKYTNPHFCQMRNGYKGITLHGEKWVPCPFNKNNLGIKEKVYINHYIYQSYEEYKRRKLGRKRDDNGKMRPMIEEKELHNKFNNVNNTFLKDNYTNVVKMYLKEHTKKIK